MFKWICYFSGLILGIVIVILLVSLSFRANLALAQSSRALETVNANLPEMVDEAKKITHTLAMLSEDVNALKQLAGVESGTRDRSLVAYASSVLDLLEAETAGADARIGLDRALGSGLKDLEPVEEFVVGARREAALIVFRAKSRQEVLHRLTHKWSGKPFYLQLGETDPVQLEAWLRVRHPDSADLPEFER